MKKSLVFFVFLTVLNIAWGMPTWEKDDSSSVIGINRRHCSCSHHHHQCGCCQNIRTHPVNARRINADVCMNASYVPSPLGADFLLTWNKKVMFNKTISDVDPRPICFDVPYVNLEACVKFKSVSMKKGHTGGCVGLEFKAANFHKFIPLGCFFFRGEDGSSLDMKTFLDPESLFALLGDFYEPQPEGDVYFEDAGPVVYLSHEKERMVLQDDVTKMVSVDQAGCKCSKSPPHCDCCVEFKLFHFPIKACIHGDVDLARMQFNLVVTINDFTVFKEHISERNPPPICRDVKLFHISMKLCLRLTNVSLAPGHMGGCVELDVNKKKFSLGCMYMQELVAN